MNCCADLICCLGGSVCLNKNETSRKPYVCHQIHIIHDSYRDPHCFSASVQAGLLAAGPIAISENPQLDLISDTAPGTKGAGPSGSRSTVLPREETKQVNTGCSNKCQATRFKASQLFAVGLDIFWCKVLTAT